MSFRCKDCGNATPVCPCRWCGHQAVTIDGTDPRDPANTFLPDQAQAHLEALGLHESPEVRIARLEAENLALKAAAAVAHTVPGPDQVLSVGAMSQA